MTECGGLVWVAAETVGGFEFVEWWCTEPRIEYIHPVKSVNIVELILC